MSGRRSMAEHAAQLARRAGEVAVCLDFDGTIAPIVEDPAVAQPLAGTIELLGPLAERYAAVAQPASYSITPSRSNMNDTAPVSARLPPDLVK